MKSDRTHTQAARWLALWLALGSVAFAPLARAQDGTEADRLFRLGLSDMQAGKYESGCPLLAESHRLDASPGALFTLAECEAAWTKAATAIEHYQAFVDVLTTLPTVRRDKFDERRRIALEKIAALSASAPEVTLEVAERAPANLVVKRDGEAIDPASYGVGKKVNPGRYLFTAELDGRTQWERTISLSLHDRAKIVVPWPLEEQRAGAAPPVRVEPVRAAPQRSPLRVWTYASVGVGAVGFSVGIVAGAVALRRKGDIDEHCPARRCDARGRDAVDAGQRAALLSTLGFAAGIAGAAAATTLLFATRRLDARTTSHARHGLRPVVQGVAKGAALGVEGWFR